MTSVRDIVLGISPKPYTESLIQAFFADVNWRFGVPQEWCKKSCKDMRKTPVTPETGTELNVH
jgi:hypothetical protein